MAITRSSSPMARTGSYWQRLATRLRCVSITPLESPVVPLENGSATTCVAGIDRGSRRGRSGRREQLLERRRPGRVADREDLLDAGGVRRLERPLGQLRHGDEKARARSSQLEPRLLGRVERVHGGGRPTGARDAVKRDGVLRHVGREDPDDLAGRQSARRKPGRAAVDVLGQPCVGQHRTADRIDDRRPRAARRRLPEHVIRERDGRHLHVRMRAANSHRRSDSTTATSPSPGV